MATTRRRRTQSLTGWLYLSPFLLLILLFLVLPILMAAWVSVSSWTGRGSPVDPASGVSFVGAANYETLLTGGGLAQQDLATSIRNTFYFVLLVVPSQTVLAFTLAMILNSRKLRAKSFFRSAYYFPSVTSSVAIAIVFLFMFANGGSVNAFLRLLGLNPPAWFSDSRGVLHMLYGAFGVDQAPAWAQTTVFSLPIWQWISGPSIAMMSIIVLVVWVSAGGYMLMYLSSLQAVNEELYEAAQIDGATAWQRIRYITIPLMRTTTQLVVMLGIIGTWQVFDQVYIMSRGDPAKTTLSPAYLSYTTALMDKKWGQGAAISFLLFALIIVFTIIQRWLTRDKDAVRTRKQKKVTA